MVFAKEECIDRDRHLPRLFRKPYSSSAPGRREDIRRSAGVGGGLNGFEDWPPTCDRVHNGTKKSVEVCVQYTGGGGGERTITLSFF